MTSISQIVPNYAIGGISDQPDELKKPGQLRDCLNAYPDVVNGLYKRPGLELLGQLKDSIGGGDVKQDGTWFPYIRQNLVSKTQENYLFYINKDSGRLLAWDEEANAIPVYYNKKPLTSNQIDKGSIEVDASDLQGTEDYFKHEDNNSLKTCTINNYTVVCNPEEVASMNSNDNKRPYEAFIEITNLAYSREYLLGIDILRDSDEGTEYRVVTDVNIVEVKNTKGNAGSPDCPGQYRKTLTFTEDDVVDSSDERGQEGLVLEIITTGQQTPVKGGKQYKCSYQHRVEIINGGRDWKKGDQILHRQPNTPIEYLIEVTGTRTVYSPSDFVITGVTTPNTGDEVATIGGLLSDLKSAIWNGSPIKKSNINITGNGLYITHDDPFTISTPESDLMNILCNTEEQIDNPYVVVNNVSRLPIECKNGIVAKVSNAFTDDDDYWVQFKSNYGDVDKDEDSAASGYWEEVAEPGTDITINSSSMPHVIIYARDGQNTIFIVSPVEWKTKTCGDEDFNPSFIGNPITNVHFYRNRLVLLSQENVVMSVAGDLFNFFPSSAIGVAADDPVDLSVSTSYSSVLQDAFVSNSGMILFSKYQQFRLDTSNDILSPNTAKVSEISRFEYDINSRPIALGTNIGFVGPSADKSSFYELTNIFNEGPVDIIERSKIVSRSIPKGLELVASSKETGLAMFGTFDEDYVWAYRYFKEGNQNDVQAAWFRWSLPDKLVNHFIIDGNYYAVLNRDGASVYVKLQLDAPPTQGPFYDYWEEDGDDSSTPYTLKLDFPTVNVLKAEQQRFRADTTASLIVHRLHYNFADIGTYEFLISRTGLDDYKVLYESRYMDAYKADADPLVPEVERTVPVYTRNTNLNVSLESSYEHPLILRSMRWEGDYNQRFYKRV